MIEAQSEGGSRPSVISLIRAIQQGTCSPSNLEPQDRQRCVEHLTAEGYSVAEIAEILQVSERTIARDRTATRSRNALERDPRLTPEMVGTLVSQAELAQGRIRRAARDKEATPAVRIDAERACWTIWNELVARLQSLGYLPTSATQIRGELTHHLVQIPGFAQMQAELVRIEAVVAARSTDRPELLERLSDLKGLVARGAASEELQDLASKLTPGAPEKDPPDADVQAN